MFFQKAYKNLLIAKQCFFSFSDKDTLSKEIESNIDYNSGRWLPKEHCQFIEAIFLFGNEWRKVERYIKTRTSAQARSHAQKFFINLQKRFVDENIQKLSMLNLNENISLDFYLIKFAITHLNCSNVTQLFQNIKIDCFDYYYKDEDKYKFYLNLQKITNTYKEKNDNVGTTNIQEHCLQYLKEKFIKLILNLLHSTRIHIRKLEPLTICNENNDNIITNLCSQPLIEGEQKDDNDSETNNPFNLGTFENEKNASTSPSNNNEFYLYDFDNIFNFN